MSHTTTPFVRRTRRGACALVVMLLLGALTAADASAAALNNGVGTKAALNSPQCDAERGRIKFVYQGWVPCVKPWAKNANNGGSTYQGVTKDSIKVVVRKAPDATTDMSRSPIKDRATGQLTTAEASVRDNLPIFEKTYQQWGRKLDVTVVEQSGTDETANRADAVKVVAMKPFAVVDLVGEEVFLSSVAKAKILAIGGSAPNKLSIAQSPYRWPVALDYAGNALLGAEFINKDLAGKPARYAGDASLQSTKRVFGSVRSDSPIAPDFEPMFNELKKKGVKVAQDLTYTPPLDASQLGAVADEAAPTLVAKLKDSGVTSILVLPSDYQMTSALTKAATKNEYFPEWIVMGVGNADVAALARAFFDQEQWKHAFGVAGLWVPPKGQTAGPSDVGFSWYWGPSAGAYSQAVFADLELLFAGIHMAGPKLTPENFKAGIFSRPPVGGAAEGQVASSARYYGTKGNLGYDEYLTGGDVALFWWDPDTVGPSVAVNLPDSKGVYQYLAGGKRYIRGQIPSNVTFFDKSNSINILETLPAADVAPDYPCNGCPSSGGTTP